MNVLATVLVLLALHVGAGAGEIDFNRDIRPLLSQNCFACHGPDAHDAKGDLQLHTAETAAEVIGAGEMLARITSDDTTGCYRPPMRGGVQAKEYLAIYAADHHIKGFSMWMAGGGIKGGTTYGATDELGYNAVEDVVHVRDLHATMLHLLGIDHGRFSHQFQGLDTRLTGVEKARVVKEVFA